MHKFVAADRSSATLRWVSRNAHFFIWLTLVFFIFKYGLEISKGGHEWKTGDWLINYESGPVRRGLFGQILIYLANLGGDLKWLVFFTQSVVYIAIYYLVIKIYLMRQRDYLWCIFILSPAFLLFPFFDIQGGFRKEILQFLSFSIISYYYANNNLNAKNIFLAYLIYLIAIFSHELNTMALPFYLYVFYRSTCSGSLQPRLATIFSVLFFIAAVFAVIFSIKFPGSTNISDDICQSLVSRGFSRDICGGAIGWLKYDVKYGFEIVIGLAKEYIFYLPIFIISIAPVFFTNWVRGPILILLVVGFISFLPLYFVAIDWGRWIYIYVFLIFVLVLSESVLDGIHIRPLPMWLVGIYLMTWSIPHCCSNRPTFGWVEWIWNSSQKIT
jgi:hypothetical protein